MAFTEQERKEALTYAINGAFFMFIPSQELSNMIIKGHPETDELNNSLKLFLIQGDAIKVETDLIVKYCKNTLDRKNTWLLDHGNIKVMPQQIKIK